MAVSSTEMLLNSDGLVVNAYRDAAGRGDYFPGSAGTSEGQFLFIIGNLRAYKATGNPVAKEMAELALKNLLKVIYRNMPVPDVVDYTHIFAPHWLFNVKYPFASSVVRYNTVIPFVGGLGVVPDPEGGVLRYAFSARSLDSKLLWENPYSPVTTGTQYAVESVSYQPGFGAKVQLGIPYTGSLYLTYSAQVGEMIAVNQPFEAWPDWRPLEPGEIACAVDVFVWAYRAFTLAAEVLANPTWAMAARATREQAAIAFDVNDSRDWIKPTWASSPFASGSRFSYSARIPAPTYSVDASGNVVMLGPTYGSGPPEIQYGNASVGDHYNEGDQTHIGIGGSQPMTVQIYIDRFQNYTEADRYYADLGLSGAGMDYFVLSRASFKNNFGATLPAGSTVYTVGISSRVLTMHSVTIGRIRQTPPRAVPYYPGAIPFTANFQGSPAQLIDWRGPIYMGYQSPYMWTVVGNAVAARTDIQLLRDAQTQWTVQTGQGKRGPFAPVFIFDRDDAVQYGPANTFGWEGPDPNTKWGGYQYRPLPEVLESVLGHPVGSQIRQDAEAVGTAFLKWLAQDRQWLPMWAPWTDLFAETIERSIALGYYPMAMIPETANQYAAVVNKASAVGYVVTDTEVPMLDEWNRFAYPFLPELHFPKRPPFGPPTDFPKGPAETNYPEPHMTALILRSIILLDEVIRPNGNSDFQMKLEYRAVLHKGMALLEAMWVETGPMAGTFSNNPAVHEWYGFWHGEILDTLSHLVTWAERANINRPSIAKQARYWIGEMLRWSKLNVAPEQTSYAKTLWRHSPNWGGGITEDFEFATSVFEASSGKEQRFSVRQEPRRRLSLRHLLTGPNAQAYDSLLRAKQNLPVLLPQWQIAVRVVEDAPAGQSFLLVEDKDLSAFRWGYEMALSRGGNALLVVVESIVGNRINIRTLLPDPVPAGSKVMPAYNSLIDQDTSASRYTGSVMDTLSSFRILPQDDFRKLPVRPPALRFPVGADNREIILRRPNWVNAVDVSQSWTFNTTEGYPAGPVFPVNGRAQGARTVAAKWSLMNLAQVDDFLGLAARLHGRRYAAWLPSWTDDFTLTRINTVANQLHVEPNSLIDFGVTDDPAVGIFVRLRDGRVFPARVSSVAIGDVECTLHLDRNTALIDPDQVEMISLLYRVRQVSDTVSLNWLTDSVAEVSAAFVSVYGEVE